MAIRINKSINDVSILAFDCPKSNIFELHFRSKCHAYVFSDLLAEFASSFRMFDTDGDGRVTKDELRITMRKLGQNPTEEELDNMMAEVDEDGRIDLLMIYYNC